MTTQNNAQSQQWSQRMQSAIDNTTPLKYDRGNRLPLYLWPAIDPGDLDDATAEQLVLDMNSRGVGIVCSWSPGDNRADVLKKGLTIAKLQKKHGLRVNINATSLLYHFFNGDGSTAHIGDDGTPFFDDSFGGTKMGCPYKLSERKHEIRERVEWFLDAYREAGVKVDFIFADWEIDGPIEVNGAWEAAKKCRTCREHIENIDDFQAFQRQMRDMRSYLQYYAYAEPVLERFPDALVGNYAIYPSDGYRYWYDYFEFLSEGHPVITDQKAQYRKWYHDFPLTGYTFAMPVVYTWYPIHTWYDFENSDYRWFYNMLLVASNVGKSTPQEIPIISFVHYNTVVIVDKPDPSVKQMSENAYQELLWHMLLRGTDTFFMWCPAAEDAIETRLVHEVYAAAQQYGEFLDGGLPVLFDVPDEPGTIVSALALGDRVLVRRTDFGGNTEPVDVVMGTDTITVPYTPGQCRIISLK